MCGRAVVYECLYCSVTVEPGVISVFHCGAEITKNIEDSLNLDVSKSMLKQLREQAQIIQASKGKPQDIEFADLDAAVAAFTAARAAL